MEEVAVRSAADMRALGRRLAGRLRPGDLVVLNGTLGAGKTTLVQGIGEGLDVRGPITSPTFVIARVHPPLRRSPRPGPPLVHVDAYRLGAAAEVDDLDLDADLDSAVTVVEWGGGLVEGLADDRLEITISVASESASGAESFAGAAGTANAEPSGAEGTAPAEAAGAVDTACGEAAAQTAGTPGKESAAGGSSETRLVRLHGIGARWAQAGSLAA